MEREKFKLPEGWKWVKLGEILKYEQPYKYVAQDTNYTDSGTPVLTARKSFILGYTQDKQGIYFNLPVIIFDDFTTDNKYVTFPFKVKSSAMKFLKEKDENVNLKFVYESMQLLKYENIGGDHKRRWISEFRYLKIPLPPLPEQQKIAEILETLDNAIEKTERIIEKYKRIKQGLMQELLTKGIDENWQIRSEKTHKFKDSPLGRIPEEWEVVRLGEVGEIISGSTPDTNNPEFWDGDIVWITPEDLSKYDKLIIASSQRKITKMALKHCSTKMIPKNSVVISTRAPIGYIKVVATCYTTNQGCKSIKFNNSFNSIFLAYLLKTKVVDMINLSGGTTFHEISKSELENLQVSLPPLPEQQRIAKVLSQIDEVIERETKYKKKLENLKRGLMEDLLTGKVRVNELL